MPDRPESDGLPDTSLQVAQSVAREPKQSVAYACRMDFSLGRVWAETSPLKRGALVINAFVFNVAGLSILAIVSAAYGWLPWWAFALTLLTTITLSQAFVIRFAGLARERITQELAATHAQEIERLQRQLQTTQAKLVGKILCLTEEIHRHESEPEGNYGDCWFTMSVRIWNDGGTATNLTGFRFYLQWSSSGLDWPARQIEGLDKYRAKSFRPSDSGSESRYTDDFENLYDFPVPSEITLTNSQRGWLRFVVRDFPLKEDMKLDKDSIITLIALDKKGEPHTIYQDSFSSLGQCPPIEERPMQIFFDKDGLRTERL